MKIEWEIGERVRCDLVAYGAVDLAGKRSTMRVFPGGNHKGVMHTEDVRSLLVLGRHGTRVTLISHDGPDWEEHPWRCIRVLKGQSIKPEKPTGLLGVRIPDIDRLDKGDARRTRQDVQESYPHADRLGASDMWTYGRFGATPLQGRVVRIRVDRDDADDAATALTDGEQVARAVLERARELAPDHVAALADAAADALRAADPKAGAAHADALRAWLDA